jgi:hypothetical protein
MTQGKLEIKRIYGGEKLMEFNPATQNARKETATLLP